MPVGIARVFVLSLFGSEVLDSVTEHLLGVVFLEHEEEPWVLALNDHLMDHQVRVIGHFLSVLVHNHCLLGCGRRGNLGFDRTALENLHLVDRSPVCCWLLLLARWLLLDHVANSLKDVSLVPADNDSIVVVVNIEHLAVAPY